MNRPSERGVSIVEVMVVTVLLGIFAAMAGPGMADFIDKRRLVAKAGQVTDLLQTVRSEAIKQSSTALTRTISVTLSPGSSWFVGASTGTAACAGVSDCTISEANGTAIARFVNAADCTGCTLAAPASQTVLTYDMRGLVSANGDTSLTLQSPKGRQVTVTVSRIGRVSTCSPSGAVGDFRACCGFPWVTTNAA